MTSDSVGRLAVWEHPATTIPKARLLLVHGLGEHSARYLHVIKYLNEHSISVVRFDLRGAGNSGGQRQWIELFEDYVDDVEEVFKWILRRDSLPLILLGHSLGGLIAIHFAAKCEKMLNGIVLSAPAYLVGQAFSPLKILVGKLISNFFPHFRIPHSLSKSHLSRDPNVVEAYIKDPLSCHFSTVRQGNEILDAMERAPLLVQKIKTPVLMVHGSDDQIILLKGSFELFMKLGSTDKTFSVFPKNYHEIHNDLDKGEYFSILVRWILSHSGNSDF